MDEKLKELGYDRRFIRILSNEEMLFFIENDESIKLIKNKLLEEFKISEDKLLKLILMSYNYEGDNEFLNKVRSIIYTEIRNRKISKILSENVLNFSEFNRLF
jgi:hypothetical protein